MKPDGNYIVNSCHYQQSSVCKGIADSNDTAINPDGKYPSKYPARPGLAFPFAFLTFWSAFLLSAPSFLPASLFFSWLERSAGSGQTKGQNESLSRSQEEEEERRLSKREVAHLFCNKIQ